MQDNMEKLLPDSNEKEALDTTDRIVREEIGRVGFRTNSWKGPLPPQVIEKISPEVADEMVRSLCRRQERQDHIVEKVIDAKQKAMETGNKQQLYFLLIGVVSFLIFVGICLFFDKTELIGDVFEIVGYLGGGSGITYIFLRKSQDQRQDISEITIE